MKFTEVPKMSRKRPYLLSLAFGQFVLVPLFELVILFPDLCLANAYYVMQVARDIGYYCNSMLLDDVSLFSS